MGVRDEERSERGSKVDAVRAAFPELEDISDPRLSETVVEIWVQTWARSAWDRLQDVPKSMATMGLGHSLVAHVRSVTRQSVAIANAIEEHHGMRCDMDLVIAAALLHDVSKLLESEPRDGGAATSQFGELIQHGVYGMHMGFAHGLSTELIHIIGSHTIESRLPPKTLEALIVHYADFADTDALMWHAGRKLFLTAAR